MSLDTEVKRNGLELVKDVAFAATLLSPSSHRRRGGSANILQPRQNNGHCSIAI